MFATLIKLPNIIATLALFLTWLLKKKTRRNEQKTLVETLCSNVLIMGVNILDPSINWIWMIILLGIFYIKNKLEQRIEKEKKKKKD